MWIESFAFAWIAVFSLALFLIGMQSYRRAESPKLALVALGFLAIFAKGMVLAISLFRDLADVETLWLLSALFDTIALVLIFLGIYKR